MSHLSVSDDESSYELISSSAASCSSSSSLDSSVDLLDSEADSEAEADSNEEDLEVSPPAPANAVAQNGDSTVRSFSMVSAGLNMNSTFWKQEELSVEEAVTQKAYESIYEPATILQEIIGTWKMTCGSVDDIGSFKKFESVPDGVQGLQVTTFDKDGKFNNTDLIQFYPKYVAFQSTENHIEKNLLIIKRDGTTSQIVYIKDGELKSWFADIKRINEVYERVDDIVMEGKDQKDQQTQMKQTTEVLEKIQRNLDALEETSPELPKFAQKLKGTWKIISGTFSGAYAKFNVTSDAIQTIMFNCDGQVTYEQCDQLVPKDEALRSTSGFVDYIDDSHWGTRLDGIEQVVMEMENGMLKHSLNGVIVSYYEKVDEDVRMMLENDKYLEALREYRLRRSLRDEEMKDQMAEVLKKIQQNLAANCEDQKTPELVDCYEMIAEDYEDEMVENQEDQTLYLEYQEYMNGLKEDQEDQRLLLENQKLQERLLKGQEDQMLLVENQEYQEALREDLELQKILLEVQKDQRLLMENQKLQERLLKDQEEQMLLVENQEYQEALREDLELQKILLEVQKDQRLLMENQKLQERLLKDQEEQMLLVENQEYQEALSEDQKLQFSQNLSGIWKMTIGDKPGTFTRLEVLPNAIHMSRYRKNGQFYFGHVIELDTAIKSQGETTSSINYIDNNQWVTLWNGKKSQVVELEDGKMKSWYQDSKKKALPVVEVYEKVDGVRMKGEDLDLEEMEAEKEQKDQKDQKDQKRPLEDHKDQKTPMEEENLQLKKTIEQLQIKLDFKVQVDQKLREDEKKTMENMQLELTALKMKDWENTAIQKNLKDHKAFLEHQYFELKKENSKLQVELNAKAPKDPKLPEPLPILQTITGAWKLISEGSLGSNRLGEFLQILVSPGLIISEEYKPNGTLQKTTYLPLYSNSVSHSHRQRIDFIEDNQWKTLHSTNGNSIMRSVKDNKFYVAFFDEEGKSYTDVYERVEEVSKMEETPEALPILQEVSGSWELVSVKGHSDGESSVGNLMIIKAHSNRIEVDQFEKSGVKFISRVAQIRSKNASFEDFAVRRDYIDGNQWVTLRKDDENYKSVKSIKDGRLLIKGRCRDHEFSDVYERTYHITDNSNQIIGFSSFLFLVLLSFVLALILKIFQS